MSRLVAQAWNPSMIEAGNGQGWLPRYSTRSTTMPDSSSTSRRTAASSGSPGSTNPARVENRPGGQLAWWPSSSRSSVSTTVMITAGSVRG